MFTLIFLFGIIIGFTAAIAGCWLIKIKCPQCKKLKPLPEIVRWHWKLRVITGQPCQQCQRPKSQTVIEL